MGYLAATDDRSASTVWVIVAGIGILAFLVLRDEIKQG
jgi:hypothetical protein